MSRKVLYVAAPLRPTEEEIHQHFCLLVREPSVMRLGRTATKDALHTNLDRAMRGLRWLRRSFPETTFIAPWIASVLAGDDDADPAQREAGLVDECAVVERCDGIVLVGTRISEGMRRKVDHGLAHHSIWLDNVKLNPDHIENGFAVYDLTRTLLALPHEAPRCRSFRIWYHQVVRGAE
ncbi:MAG TPA: hypothetical protein VI172_10760 [Candidatus Dormibacteraeota bacterium]|jgi:hypothetical protein